MITITLQCPKCNAESAQFRTNSSTKEDYILTYGKPLCRLCCLEERLYHMKKVAETIPELEQRIKKLKEEKHEKDIQGC